METIRFKNDTATRRRLMVPESFSHPAKGHLGMWQEMILRYSKEGDTVLDPMAGSGATLLAALMGRTAILVELEEHFVEPMRASWEKMRQHPMLGYTMGEAMIVRGDARCLPLGAADSIITSPPFQDQMPAADPAWFAVHRSEFGGGSIPGSSYTRPQVDAVVTSPPFGEALTGGGIAKEGYVLQGGKHTGAPDLIGDRSYMPRNQGEGAENIGNLRSDAYWSAMRQVYTECWRILRPGGLMALVLKGFTRDGKYVDLPGQTEALLLAAGWEKHDHWRRELWSLSFWRILQKRRDPAAFDNRLMFEEVLAFRKPEGPGNGVATVLTSPPYEGAVDDKRSPEQHIKQSRRDPKAGGGYGSSLRAPGYTRPSAVIMSPPYEGSEVAQSSDGEANRRFRAGEYQGDALKGMGLSKGYTRPKGT